MLINDIGLQLEKRSAILYADDTVISTLGQNSAVVAEKLNHDFTTLRNFFNDNSLVVNYKTSRTEFLLFGSHQRLSKNITVDNTMNGEKISETRTAPNGLAPNLFKNYFCNQNHTKGIRGNNANLAVPPMRIEVARKTFYYQGAQIYNKLLITIQTEISILRFKTL